jgi:hypothetical protein
MDILIRGIDFTSFCDVLIGLWNCLDSVVFFFFILLIAALRIMIEQSLEWNTSLFLNFVDFEKAFDSLDREVLWNLMAHYGIPQ